LDTYDKFYLRFKLNTLLLNLLYIYFYRIAGKSLINSARKASLFMIRAITKITQTLETLPSQVFINMKLDYYVDSMIFLYK
jgi:hypothetical protein